jgi:hypothetical protein
LFFVAQRSAGIARMRAFDSLLIVAPFPLSCSEWSHGKCSRVEQEVTQLSATQSRTLQRQIVNAIVKALRQESKGGKNLVRIHGHRHVDDINLLISTPRNRGTYHYDWSNVDIEFDWNKQLLSLSITNTNRVQVPLTDPAIDSTLFNIVKKCRRDLPFLSSDHFSGSAGAISHLPLGLGRSPLPAASGIFP